MGGGHFSHGITRLPARADDRPRYDDRHGAYGARDRRRRGSKNVPLGRAVIGGLLIATLSTLFFVPVVYSYVRRKGYQELFAE